jgi:hypothetical protein
VVIEGRSYKLLALNSRIDIEKEAAVLLSSWGTLESKAMSLRRSNLPVVMFKCDGDAWCKQFWRRLQQVAEGDKTKNTVMSLFYDTRLQFGDACAAHRTYRVTYRLIWMLLEEDADRRATNPKVREWQRLQLDLIRDGIITEANLAYFDMDGFVDDFMAFCQLAGEHEFLLTSFLGLMCFLGIKVSYKKLVSDAASFHVKIMLGFCMDLKRGIGYLDLKWKLRFIEQLEEAISAARVSIHDLQVIGGKTIRVCCLFRPLRIFLNGIFAAIKGAHERKTIKNFIDIFRYDCEMILHVLKASPSRQLLYEPRPVASIATGASYTDCDASTGWGMGLSPLPKTASTFSSNLGRTSRKAPSTFARWK